MTAKSYARMCLKESGNGHKKRRNTCRIVKLQRNTAKNNKHSEGRKTKYVLQIKTKEDKFYSL